MSSSPAKLSPDDEGGNSPDETVIAGRATMDQVRLIDIAAAIDGQKRGPWLTRVAVERAELVIKAHSKQVVKDSAA